MAPPYIRDKMAAKCIFFSSKTTLFHEKKIHLRLVEYCIKFMTILFVDITSNVTNNLNVNCFVCFDVLRSNSYY